MYVVRIENDEATMYRVFRRLQSAKAWAWKKNLDDIECHIDIFESPDSEDIGVAVAATRDGRLRVVARVEASI